MKKSAQGARGIFAAAKEEQTKQFHFGNQHYDTETAQLLGQYDNGKAQRDAGHMTEALYRTPEGEYFLFGQGGKSSCYARVCSCGNRDNGARILPITAQRAQGWAQEHLTAEEYAALFGPAQA